MVTVVFVSKMRCHCGLLRLEIETITPFNWWVFEKVVVP